MQMPSNLINYSNQFFFSSPHTSARQTKLNRNTSLMHLTWLSLNSSCSSSSRPSPSPSPSRRLKVCFVDGSRFPTVAQKKVHNNLAEAVKKSEISDMSKAQYLSPQLLSTLGKFNNRLNGRFSILRHVQMFNEQYSMTSRMWYMVYGICV